MSILEKLGKDVASNVESAKSSGCVVEHITLGGKDFIYRSLNRFEWKSLQQDAMRKAKGPDGNVDPTKVVEIKDESEDAVVMKALIYPKHETVSELSSYPAGHISQLADRITELTGFGDMDVAPTRL